LEKGEIKKNLIAIVGNDGLLTDTLMRDHTSFRVGGAADFLVLPETPEQLTAVLAFCRKSGEPLYLMGNGSNLLVRDGGYRGIMIKTRAMDAISVKGTQLSIEAGAMLRKAAAVALDHHLSGMAFASGIPGSVGGAVVMNAGAYGGEMQDIVESIEVVTERGEYKKIPGNACHFGYRKSIIQENPWTILRINLGLSPGDYNTIKSEMDDFNRRRREKQPLDMPSAGSTFRRPEGFFAGKLVQDAGFKGYRVGGAQVSEKHSGFVVNAGGATAEDILTLIKTIQDGVKKQFGVELKTEVIVIGEV
jgi:UDP-N-acetylmuramate dehydrogenase